MIRILVLLSLVLVGFPANADTTPQTVDPTASEATQPLTIDASTGADWLNQKLNHNDRSLFAQRCCKVCKKGKACGDSCIPRAYTCRVGPGCACDSY